MFGQLPIAGFVNDVAEDERRDDGVVGVPDHRKEVRHQVDRQREVAEQEPNEPTRTTWDLPVRGQASHEAQRVRKEAEHVAEGRVVRLRHPHDDEQSKPERHNRHDGDEESSDHDANDLNRFRMTSPPDSASRTLLRRGFILEAITLGWNVVGVAVLAIAAWTARSVALAGFGLDSLVEIGASTVVIWQLSGTGEDRQRRALRWIGVAFVLLAIYVTVQSIYVLAVGHHPKDSPLGIAWTGATAVMMFTLAAGKARTGAALANPVLRTEGRVTFIDGLLATAVLLGLVLNASVGAWWADPLAGFVIVFYGLREATHIFWATEAEWT